MQSIVARLGRLCCETKEIAALIIYGGNCWYRLNCTVLMTFLGTIFIEVRMAAATQVSAGVGMGGLRATARVAPTMLGVQINGGVGLSWSCVW